MSGTLPTRTDPPRRILVPRIRYIGDTFLLRYPLRALRTAFPEAQIDALVSPGTAPVIRSFGLCNCIEWPSSGLWEQVTLCAKICSTGYDWVLDLTGNDRSAFLSLLARAPFRAGYVNHKDPPWFWRGRVYSLPVRHEKYKPHIVRQHARLLEACGVPCPLDPLPPQIPSEATAWAIQQIGKPGARRVLQAHLVSRDMQKSLPAEIAQQVLAHFVHQGWFITLTTGRSTLELEHTRRCCFGLPEGSYRIISECSWDQLAALLDIADLYLGADTAPSHLADALEKPMLVFFGPSRSRQWHPLNPRARILVADCPCLNKRTVCEPSMSGRCLRRMDISNFVSLLEEVR